MALNIGKVSIDLALHVTADSCEHVLPEARRAIYAQLGDAFPGIVLAGELAKADERPRIVSRPSYTRVEPDEQVVDPGTAWSSTLHAEGILARLRGVQLTPEDGHRIVEAVWTRVL